MTKRHRGKSLLDTTFFLSIQSGSLDRGKGMRECNLQEQEKEKKKEKGKILQNYSRVCFLSFAKFIG